MKSSDVNVSGNVPEPDAGIKAGVCIYGNGTWYEAFTNKGDFICEQTGTQMLFIFLEIAFIQIFLFLLSQHGSVGWWSDLVARLNDILGSSHINAKVNNIFHDRVMVNHQMSGAGNSQGVISVVNVYVLDPYR